MAPEREKLLKEAIDYLDGALHALAAERRKSRLSALYRWFLRPLALFGALVSCALLSLVFFALGCRGSLCFSLGVLCYMVPLLAHIWRTSDIRNLEYFWPEIHRADEVMAQLGDRALLMWPTQHPEDGWELGATPEELEQWVLARRSQLQQLLEGSTF